LWGNNTVTVQDSGDNTVAVCRSLAFTKKPTLTFGKEAGNRQWVFNAGLADTVVGTY
jgi:hypothetical protein